MKYVLGMDCGTTNCKAVIISEEGRTVAEAACPNRFIRPEQGYHEQDADEWWRNAVRLFRSLREQAGSRIMERVAGICVSSHTVSMLPVDDRGKPLRNAITYQDERSYGELRYIVDKIGRERPSGTHMRGECLSALAWIPAGRIWQEAFLKERQR